MLTAAGGTEPGIGSSKRYSQHYDRLMNERVLQRIARENRLQSLTEKERQADTLPVTRDPQPKPCRAWVRFGPHAVHVDATVVVWNDLACGVQFRVGDGELRCWVWTNAVTPAPGPARDSLSLSSQRSRGSGVVDHFTGDVGSGSPEPRPRPDGRGRGQ